MTPSTERPAHRELDATDRAIVAALQREGRISMRALAERVGIARASAYTRVERLEAEGVITGYGARVDPMRAGLATSAYVSVAIRQNAWRDVREGLLTIPYVQHVALVGADFDVLVHVVAPDNAALRSVVLEGIQAIEGVEATRTWLAFEEHPGRG